MKNRGWIQTHYYGAGYDHQPPTAHLCYDDGTQPHVVLANNMEKPFVVATAQNLTLFMPKDQSRLPQRRHSTTSRRLGKRGTA